MKMDYEQLESVIFRIGSEIAKKAASTSEIDKALGVLSGDGVYAYYVYVISKKIDSVFLDAITDLMEYTDTKLNKKNYKEYDYQEYFTTLSSDIKDLLFFKEILSQTLTYARYHSKAEGK
jgi:hypothetical protein